MAPLTGVPEEIGLAQFINGLKADIKAEVRVLGPLNLDHAMELAVKVEEKLRTSASRKFAGHTVSSTNTGNSYASTFHSQASFSGSGSRSMSVFSQSASSPSSPSVKNSGGTSGAKPLGEFRKLNDKELQAKREKGECFRCDEKWSIRHRCKRKELSVILMQGEDGDDEPEETLETVLGCPVGE